MELMSTSFDKFYKYVYCALDDVIPEEILGKITLAVSFHAFSPYIIYTDSFDRKGTYFSILIYLLCVFITDCEST